MTLPTDDEDPPPEAMLARVHPVQADFWSIRVTEPSETPGIRSLGAFGAFDEFVALTWELREEMGDFDAHVDEARAIWRDLFGSERPYQGDNVDAYLSQCRSV